MTTTAMNRRSRNVVRASTVYEPSKALAGCSPDRDDHDRGEAESDERGRERQGRATGERQVDDEDGGGRQDREDQRRDRDHVLRVQCAAPASATTTLVAGAAPVGAPPPVRRTHAMRAMTPMTIRPTRIATSSGRTSKAVPESATCNVSTTVPWIRSSSSPGWMPKTTTSVASGDERQDLHRLDIGQVVAETLEERRDLAEDQAVVHVQQVAGAQDHHERRDRGGGRAGHERPDQDEELADEAGQARQAGGREDEEAEQRGVDRDPGASPLNLAMVRSCVRS